MTATHELNETFEVIDDHLVRKVVPRHGEPYEHRCLRKAFEQVAHAVEELASEGFTLESLVQHEDLPFTQVAVVTRYRRNYAATDGVHLDAMTEYFALAENG